MGNYAGNAAAYFVDRHLTEGRGHKAAFIEVADDTRQLTYGELAAQTSRMPSLLQRHDMRAEERAAMIVLDTIEFPVIFWGCLKAGVVPIPLNTLLSAEYFEIILNDSRARALFVSSELLDVIEPILGNLPHLKKIFVIGGKPTRHLAFDAELGESQEMPSADASSDQCAFWLYSSGSTGRPKGVKHVHGSLHATVETFGKHVLGIREDDVVLSAAKLFFAYGLGNAMTFPMSVGSRS